MRFRNSEDVDTVVRLFELALDRY
ncbi:MAG: hypothetical protein AB7G93_19560 [Bdellovibrionales bacterium]